MSFNVIVGVDANVQLLASMGSITGAAVMPARRSFSPPKVRLVAAWIAALDFRAMAQHPSKHCGREWRKVGLLHRHKSPLFWSVTVLKVRQQQRQ